MSQAQLEGWRHLDTVWPDPLYEAIVRESRSTGIPFAQVIRTCVSEHFERQKEGSKEAEAEAQTNNSTTKKEK